MEIKIKNFKLNVFKNLLEQSLIVDNQLMFEISPEFIRSCSFSATKSFMKLWTVSFQDLIQSGKESDEVAELFPEQNEPVFEDFDKFNMYILKGDLFKKFLSVHVSDTVDLIFNVQKIDGKLQASNLEITGISEGNNHLVTNFVLATEELITNKIDDYADIIRECSPEETMDEFILSDIQMQEIKRFIKKLHKSIADNTAYLTFNVDAENQKLVVNDKVFNVSFELAQKPKNSFKFNILKSDFIITGNHTFSIYTEDNTQKVIFGARYAGGLIWCLTTKVGDQSDLNLDASIVDTTIESLDSIDIDEYL